ncbi:bile acid:sodium symporter family protein [Ectobacillus sp. sgz5001026]|uniref:bile acid:sodium symporter family protein n=1 Tax=Ectobacillus sp. sgz5001026 TaxID=3242473 RepID=UPI0036D22AFA
MLSKLNRFLEKVMPIITPTSVVLGVFFADHLKSFAFLVAWIFAFITFTGSLGSSFKSLKRVVLHPLPTIVVLVILHILMPIVAWLLGHLSFSGDPFTITGLILAVVIPTGVTSLIWTTIYKGNAVLALSIILIDTLLSPLIVPYSIALLGGGAVSMDVWPIMKGLLGMVVLPSILGMLLNQLTAGKVKTTIGKPLSPFSKIGVGLVVMINSANVAPYLVHINGKLVLICFMILVISTSGYALSWLTGKVLHFDKEDVITLTFTGGMRNISAGAVVAITYFPAAVAVPVILGMLFQQTLASLNGHVLDRYYKKREIAKAS